MITLRGETISTVENLGERTSRRRPSVQIIRSEPIRSSDLHISHLTIHVSEIVFLGLPDIRSFFDLCPTCGSKLWSDDRM